MKDTHVKVTSERLTSVDEARARLEPHLGTHEGWVQYASQCITSRPGEPVAAPEPGKTRGFPLAAEFTDGARSWSLRQAGDGWAWTEVVEGAEGEACRAGEQDFVSTERGWRLGYRVFWRRDEGQVPVHPWTPWVSRFTGWKKEQGAS